MKGIYKTIFCLSLIVSAGFIQAQETQSEELEAPDVEVTEKEEIIEKPSSEDAEGVEQALAPEPVSEDEIYMLVEEMPKYTGGDEALISFISSNISYPKEARKNNIEGRVILKFIVNEDGGISNVEVLRDLGFGCGEEAARVVAMMPNWKPGKQRGIPVKTYFTMPIAYKLQDPAPKKELTKKEKKRLAKMKKKKRK